MSYFHKLTPITDMNISDNLQSDFKKPWYKHKGKMTALICVVIALILIVGIAGFNLSKAYAADDVVAHVDADGYNADTSTPVELSIYKDDVVSELTDNNNLNDPDPIDTLTTNANEDANLNIDEIGTYTIAVSATPILEDGTMFETPDPIVIEVGGDDQPIANFELTKLDLENASASEVEAIVEAATDANSTDNGATETAAVAAATKAATEKATAETEAKAATNNTASSDNSSNASINSGSSTANNSKSSSATSNNSSKSTNSSSSNKSSNTSSSSSAKSSSNSGSSSSSTKSSSTSSSSSSSSSTHTHNWVAQYITQYTNGEAYIQCSCGATFSNTTEWGAHNKADLLSGGKGHSYHVAYKQVATQTLTGYKCSICGATKSA